MFTIHDAQTGEIKRTSATADLGPGESAIAGSYSSSTHYVKNGVATPLPPKMNPEDNSVFDYWLERWVIEPGMDTRPILDRRSKLLRDSDWTMMPDVTLWNKEAWAEYRQALRDLTEQPGYPTNIVWPTPPDAGKNAVYRVGSM